MTRTSTYLLLTLCSVQKQSENLCIAVKLLEVGVEKGLEGWKGAEVSFALSFSRCAVLELVQLRPDDKDGITG